MIEGYICPRTSEEGYTPDYCEGSCEIEGIPKGCKFLSTCEVYNKLKR